MTCSEKNLNYTNLICQRYIRICRGRAKKLKWSEKLMSPNHVKLLLMAASGESDERE